MLESNIVPINLVAVEEIKVDSATRDKLSVLSNNIAECGILFTKAINLCTIKVNSDEMSPTNIASTCVGSSQIAVNKASTFQVTRSDLGISKVAVAEFSPYQIATSQVDTAQIDIVKSSASEVNTLQFGPTQVSILQNDVLKVSTTSSIPSEQFLSVHNSTPTSISTTNLLGTQ